MRQVGFLGMRNLLDADPDQEIGHSFEVVIHVRTSLRVLDGADVDITEASPVPRSPTRFRRS